MAAYGTLVAWAKALGLEDAAGLLQETLDEEKAADEKLTALAESGVNQEAADAEDGDRRDHTRRRAAATPTTTAAPASRT